MVDQNDFLNVSFDALDQLRCKHPDHYFCPVCRTLAPKFNNGGVGKPRPNAKCPTCGSLERHRLFWVHLVNRVWPRLPEGKKDVLHIAPEPFLVDLLKPRPDVNYVSGDLMMSASMAKMDLTDIAFWDAQFDLIICSHVLEHIPEDIKAMREMRRVLRPGGILLVMVPMYGEKTYEDFSITEPKDRLAHFGQEDHVRKYGRDIVGRLEEAGFDAQIWPEPDQLKPELTRFLSSKGRNVIECSV